MNHRVLFVIAIAAASGCGLSHPSHSSMYISPVEGPTAELSIPNRGFFDEVLLDAVEVSDSSRAGGRKSIAVVPNGDPPATVTIRANRDFSFVAGARNDGHEWCFSYNTIHDIVPGNHYHVILWKGNDKACVVEVVQGEPDQFLFEMEPVKYTAHSELPALD